MIARASHLREHLVQPLEGAMQVHLDPARGGGDVLPVILGSPAFHKAHPDSAHFSQLVDRLISMVNRLSEKGGELLVVEDLEAAAGWDLAHRGWVEPVLVVTVSRLHKYGRVAETFRIDLPTHIIKVNSLPNVTPRVLDSRVAVHIGQLAKTEPVVVLVAGVGEPVDDHRVVVGMVHLAHPAVQLVVRNGRPVEWLLKLSRSNILRRVWGRNLKC